MAGACILVFGVSGVGKSRACADYADRHPEWLHLRAGELLGRATGDDPEELRTASEEVVVANQGLLAAATARARRGREDRPVLIDAHAVIDNDDGYVVVPVQAVAALAPAGLALLEHDAGEVAWRRDHDPRVRPTRPPAAIAEEAALERATVGDYSAALGIPLRIARTGEGFRLDGLVEALLGPEGTSRAG